MCRHQQKRFSSEPVHAQCSRYCDYILNLSNENCIFSAAPYLITAEPKDYIVKIENNTGKFECKVGGEPTPKIEWTHNTKPIDPSALQRLLVHNKHNKNTTIRISGDVKEDTGNYGCNASNIHGYIYIEFYVNVPSGKCWLKKVFFAKKEEDRWCKYIHMINF
jgi:Immunoglobulin I-set domain